MKIASWNINGIKARHDVLLEWLRQSAPDIACLQEIKSVDEAFPGSQIEELGYNVETHGQKGFNGVAILSKLPFDEVNRGLPMLATSTIEDEQARFIEGVFSVDGRVLRVISLYLPNGNPVNDPRKFDYKLEWMDRLHAWAEGHLALEEPFILAGDYNVIPQNKDCWDPQVWQGDALFRPESRSRFEALKNLGLTEALRSSTDAAGIYTFWDYQAGAWPKNHGIRIDHLLLSPEATLRFSGCEVDKYVRDWEKPSDHVPIWLEYN
ncbi:MAG: exodeoxyribonuclease III [Rhizobiaceae bacterium]|nr:exodeoxyribonuclease III [Rhizobiaceae bacterium]